MNQEDVAEQRREAARAVNAAKRRKEVIELTIAITLISVIAIILFWGILEVVFYCADYGCGS
jgi:hypothetical protein